MRHALPAFSLALVCSLCGCSDDGASSVVDTGPPACSSQLDCADTPATPECAVSLMTCAPRGWHIGVGDGTPTTVDLVEIFAAPGRDKPTGLAFNPQAPNELWVIGYTNGTVTIITDPGLPSMSADRIRDPAAGHFANKPTGFAFGSRTYGDNGKNSWGTCGDNNNPEGGNDGFMGPALFPSDRDILGIETAGGLGSHLDMLHNSPNSVGIAWEADNVYWVVDGAHRSLTRYDFASLHERGGVDHRTGTVLRYAEGMITYTEGVSSHAEWDAPSSTLFVSDAGSNRVIRFTPEGATMGTTIVPNYDGTRQRRMTGGTVETFIDGSMNELRKPCGLALVGDRFYVTDAETSRITVFDRMGRRVDWLDLAMDVPAGGLQGITLDARGYIYVVNSVGAQVLEIAPR